MRRRGECELNQKGLTLIELMVALAIGFIVIAAVYQAFTSQQRTYTIQDQVAEAQQSARAAMNILMRDLRMAGHGMPAGDVVIAGETYRHSIDVENDPENDGSFIITLVGCFGSPNGYLTRTADEDETQIAVRSTGNELSQIFDPDRSDHIFIGGMERLRVTDAPESDRGILTLNGSLAKRYPTGVLSALIGAGATQIPLRNTDGLRAGDTLFLGQDRLIVIDVGADTITIDTDPDTAGNQGVSGSYPAETFVNPVPIYRLTALIYYIESDPRSGYLVLRRHDMVEGNRTLAENIQQLEVTPDDHDQPLYEIRLTARTRVQDPDYRENEGFRTRVLESQVRLRNL
ncbi:MAG: prepilin-type N-terminal cleavage/methylation domain-containing protein [Syntrophobacterales bacterium]|nr:MAG: prepilin-type N-terminal cleavage/methylation domain-containing protein [Syntrophobacterales bacterium]